MTLKCSLAVGAAALTLTIVLVPVRSKAADDGAHQRFEQIHTDCVKEGEAAGPIAYCMLEKEKEYGNELERLYQRLLKDATLNVPVLRKSQRAWLEYQKQTCKLYELKAASEGQIIGRLSLAGCLLLTTLERIDELHNLLED